MSTGDPVPAAGPSARLFALLALASFGAVAVALVSQHRYGMEPCAWCVLQRLLFLGVGVAALLGLVWRTLVGTRVAAVLGMLVADAGIAAAAWMWAVASKSESCNLTLADRLMNATGLPTWLPDVFEARASCADASVPLLGVDYAIWAMAGFAACSALATVAGISTFRPRTGRGAPAR